MVKIVLVMSVEGPHKDSKTCVFLHIVTHKETVIRL